MSPERTDLLTMSGEELFGQIIPGWGTPGTFTSKSCEKLAALRDAIVTAARQSDEAGKREAASKAWDACSAMVMGYTNLDARDRYLAAHHPLPPRECVLSDGSVVTRTYSRIEESEVLVHDRNGNGRIYALGDFTRILRPLHTGADFDKLKAFAAALQETRHE